MRVRWLKRKLQYSVGGVCVGVALAVGDETTADGAQLHPPLFRCA